RLFAENIKKHPELPRHIILDNVTTLSPNQQEAIKSLIANCDAFTAALAVPGIGAHCDTWDDLQKYVHGSALENVLRFWQQQNTKFTIIESEYRIYTDKLTGLV